MALSENDLISALKKLNDASIALTLGKNPSMNELEHYQLALKQSMHAIGLAEMEQRKSQISGTEPMLP